MLFRRRQGGDDVVLPAPPVEAEGPLPGGGRTVIGLRTRVRGTLSGEGPILVCGAVEGGIDIRGNLTIAPSGRVEADVEARSLEVGGEARGSVRARARVLLTPTAVFEGDIATPVLEVRPGSVLRGRTRVAGASIDETTLST